MVHCNLCDMNGHVGHGNLERDPSPARIRSMARRMARDLRDQQNRFRYYFDTSLNFNNDLCIIMMMTFVLIYVFTLMFLWFQLRSWPKRVPAAPDGRREEAAAVRAALRQCDQCGHNGRKLFEKDRRSHDWRKLLRDTFNWGTLPVLGYGLWYLVFVGAVLRVRMAFL